MKSLMIVLLLRIFFASTAEAGDRVERFIPSDSLLVILDGNWLEPEGGGYTIVMTDTNVTVNGYEYVHPEVLEPPVAPSKTREFIAWIADTTYKVALQMIVEGKTAEEARIYMNQVFAKYAACDSFRLDIDKYGNFLLYPRKGYQVALVVTAPTHVIEKVAMPSYRARMVEPLFNYLVSSLENGCLVMRGTRNGSILTFPASVIDQIKPELRGVSKIARVKRIIKDRTLYEPIKILGRDELASSEIDLLVHPRKLIRR